MPIRTALIVLAVLFAAASPARASDADWLRGMHGRKTTTRGEVLLAATLAADDANWRADERWALAASRSRGMVSGDEAGDLSRPASRAFACKVFARLLKIRGGLVMRLSGQAGRYAYRELVLHGLIPDGPSHLVLTGDELVGLLNGAAKYQENGPTRPPGM